MVVSLHGSRPVVPFVHHEDDGGLKFTMNIQYESANIFFFPGIHACYRLIK